MKKISLLILLIMVLVISFLSAYSQGKRLGQFDIEFDAGMTIPVTPSSPLGRYDVNSGVTFKLEGRYNFKKTPINAGIQINMSRFDWEMTIYDFNFNSSNTETAMGIMPVADYSFRRGKKINPYAGVGVAVIIRSFQSGFSQSNYRGIITPRV